MSGTYDEETRKLLETRKRRAELRRAQQIKKRNNILFGIAVIIVLIILIALIGKSCSSDKNAGKQPVTTKPPVTTEAETTPVETTVAEISMYTTDILNLRKEPNTDCDIITKIGAGKKVTVLSEEGQWCKVKYGVKTGYVMKTYLSTEKNTVN